MIPASEPVPEQAPPEPRWGLGDAIAGLVVANVAAVFIGALILVASGHAETDPDDLPLTLIAVLQVPLWSGYLGAPLLAARLKGRSLKEDFGLWARGKDIPFGLVVGALTQVILVPLLYLPIFWFTGEKDVSADARALTDRADSPVGVVLLILIVVVGAPVIEELFFRGLLLRSIERRWGGVAALIGSSLVFGLVHLQLLQLPALVLFGFIAGALTLRAGRLGPAIFAHVAFNAVAVATLLAS